MPYRHDIFISYRRDDEALKWIKVNFLPLLQHRVHLALGNVPKIYVHEVKQQIAAGETWTQALGEELGASRVLVALWSKPFFNSVWCAKEMCHMLARERDAGCRTSKNKYGIVIPAVVHGDSFPKQLDHIERMDIRCCYNTRMREDSLKAEELSEVIALHAEGIAAAIQHAPRWKKAWSQSAANSLFRTLFSKVSPTQTKIPRFNPK